jgi:hypothetical protein
MVKCWVQEERIIYLYNILKHYATLDWVLENHEADLIEYHHHSPGLNSRGSIPQN